MIRKLTGKMLMVFSPLFLISCASLCPQTPFLSHPVAKTHSGSFQSTWLLKTTDWRGYDKIFIEPVMLDFADTKTLVHIPSQDLIHLGHLLDQTLSTRLARRFQILHVRKDADETSLILEPALVKVQKPHPLLAWMWPESAAIQIKILDGYTTEQTLAELSESRRGSWNLKPWLYGPFSNYDHVKSIFSAWSGKLEKFFEPK